MRIFSIQPNYISNNQPKYSSGINNRSVISFQGAPGCSAVKEAENAVPTLLLFTMKGCPACERVMAFLNKHKEVFMENGKLKVGILDIAKPENQEEYKRLGGVRYVPYFVDTKNNIRMYESRDIIKHLATLLPKK